MKYLLLISLLFIISCQSNYDIAKASIVNYNFYTSEVFDENNEYLGQGFSNHLGEFQITGVTVGDCDNVKDYKEELIN